MPIRFISRLSKVEEKRLGFYVPKYATDFYGLKAGDYKGGISQTHGEVNSCPIKLSKYRKTLKGTLPSNLGQKDSIVEVWIYRDTWVASKKK